MASLGMTSSPSPTRRDFVAMLLGAPIAATVGCGARARSLPGGEIVSTGMTRGHARIRDAGAIALAAASERRCRGAIVGGGVAGLTAAGELRRRGVKDVVVLELDDVIGGTARGGE